MAVEIKLRRKYLVGNKGKYKGGEHAVPKKNRKKVGAEAHKARHGDQRLRVKRVDGKTGKSRMEDA